MDGRTDGRINGMEWPIENNNNDSLLLFELDQRATRGWMNLVLFRSIGSEFEFEFESLGLGLGRRRRYVCVLWLFHFCADCNLLRSVEAATQSSPKQSHSSNWWLFASALLAALTSLVLCST